MPPELTSTFPAMGGQVELQCDSSEIGRIQALFARHEQALSRFLPDSELCALNASAGRPFLASPLLFDGISEACGWACITEGIFDPTVIDTLEAIGYDRPFDEIARSAEPRMCAARGHGRWREIAFDFERDLIRLPAGVRLDLGGIGKGYTVDRAIESLAPAGRSLLINASGDLYAAGGGPEGDGWRIGVADPCAPERDLAVIVVRDRGVATSGSSKRRWGTDDRYHHLIDARAGRSSESDLLSVTVIAGSATAADVLAKTVFLLGSSAGLRFINETEGVECLAVRRDGSLVMSTGLAAYTE